MPITLNNLKRFERYAKAVAFAQVQFAATSGKELYKEAVSQGKDDNTPTGPFRGPSSKPGQYPFQDSTQGFRNIAAEFKKRKRIAAFGVKGPDRGTARTIRTAAGVFKKQVPGGLHLIFLLQKGRKGPVHVVRENRSKIIAASKRGARSIRP